VLGSGFAALTGEGEETKQELRRKGCGGKIKVRAEEVLSWGLGVERKKEGGNEVGAREKRGGFEKKKRRKSIGTTFKD